jgi:hypothetical protein
MGTRELKTRKTEADVGAFLKKVPDPVQRADAKVVLEIMQKATKAPATLWGPSIIGFGDRVLRYASGRELDWFHIGFSPRKGKLSLYIMNGFSRSEALLGKLGKHSTEGSCLYIKRLCDVDLGVLKEMIEGSVAHLSKGT